MKATRILEVNRPYEPRGAAMELMRCRAGEVLMEGPAGTGKTRALLEKANLCAIRYPRMRGLLLRKTRESMTESVLVTFEEKVIPPGWPILRGGGRRHRQAYLYPNGSSLVVGGIDRASRIMSTEFDLVLAFEARELTEDDWESLLSRLRNGRMPYQQAIADTNPDAPSHWLNRRANRGLMARLLSRHDDNPKVSGGYLSRLDGLTGVRRDRLLRGVWAAADGLVYPGFDPATHVISRFDPPATWRRIRAIDFGFTHPFVCQWWAIDGDGRMYLYREAYQRQRLVEDHARDIRAWSEGEAIEVTVADHDAEDRATLERHGVPTVPAMKSLSAGIQAVAARLRRAGDGRPRLFLLRDSLMTPDRGLADANLPWSTEHEFVEYIWAQRTTGHPARAELPADRHNHGLDALRYAVAYVDNLGSVPLDARVV